MPNPLSRIPGSWGHIELGEVGTGTLASRPALALAAMECIATWSHVENFMFDFYADLAGGVQSDAAAVFFAVDGSGPKRAIVSALAARKLDPARLNLFNALTRLTKAGQKERDRLAHWIWGVADNLPDALLLADPRDASHSADTILVYAQRDFDAIRSQFERLATLYFNFRLIARGQDQSHDIFDALSAERSP